jgi:hypothetical protein
MRPPKGGPMLNRRWATRRTTPAEAFPPGAGQAGRKPAVEAAQPPFRSPPASPMTTGATPTARKAGRKHSPTGAVIRT